MSPEQASGEQDLDARSDQYALGCVLYEMLAGHPPFTGAQVEAVVRQHLTQDPPSVTQARPAVNEEVSKVIIRSLAKSPADRFKTCGEMAAALALTTTPVKARSPLGRAKAVIYGATVILGLATVAVIASFWPEGGSDLPEDYVAVFPFENLTGDPGLDQIGSLAAYVITDGFGWVEGLRAAATQTVAQALQAGGEAEGVLDTAVRLGVGIAVTGVYTLNGTNLEFRAQVLRVASGELINTVQSSGSSSDPTVIMDELRQRLLGGLAMEVLRDSLGPVLPHRPPTLEALQIFEQGLRTFWTRAYGAALPHFYRAYELDSTFLDPLRWALSANMNMGLYATADSLAGVLESHRGELSPLGQLTLDWAQASIRGDLEGELRATRARARATPDALQLYLLGLTALQNGRPAEALRAFEQIELDSEMAQSWSPGWQVAARVYHLNGLYGEALETAREGQNLFPEWPYGGTRSGH